MLALEFTMGLLLGLGLFQRNNLRLGPGALPICERSPGSDAVGRAAFCPRALCTVIRSHVHTPLTVAGCYSKRVLICGRGSGGGIMPGDGPRYIALTSQ